MGSSVEWAVVKWGIHGKTGTHLDSKIGVAWYYLDKWGEIFGGLGIAFAQNILRAGNGENQ